MKKFEGKKALVTGGGSGVGLAIARQLVEQGARVVITGRDAQVLKQAEESLGEGVLAIRADSAALRDLDRVMHHVREHMGTLDAVFVNAAVAMPAQFDHVDDTRFDDVMKVNVKGAFFTVQKTLPLLAPSASVVLTTAIANQAGSPNFSVFAASKAAMRSLVQSLALELLPRGVRVNAVSPGPVDTPMWGKLGLAPHAEQALRQEMVAKSPSKRLGRADEVARVALFLASDDASYVVGQEIVVDGGMSLL